MEKKKTGSKLIRLLISLAVLGVLVGVGYATGEFKLFDLSGVNFSWKAIIKLLVMIFGVLVVESLFAFILSVPNPKSHRAKSVLSVISSLLKYVAAIIIICWGLSIIGVNVSTIVASVGILALVVGFSAESLIADVVTGAFMIFENQYNVGDIVEIDGFRGTVTSIGIRTTGITDPGGNVKIVNNSAIKTILNRSDRVSRSVSDIAIPYGTELEKLEAGIPTLTEEIYAKHTDVMKAPPKYLGVQQLADSSVVLRFVVDVEEKDIYSGARILNHDLLLGFRALGVECPFPQIDVHTY